MSWATKHIELLKKGTTVQFRPKGNSMSGKIESGQLCTVVPIKVEELSKGDIVLCKVKGNQYLHLVKAIKNNQCLIENNKGYENGWTSQIYGKCIKVED
jgi:SOS-response transcriptional repressor LexA